MKIEEFDALTRNALLYTYNFEQGFLDGFELSVKELEFLEYCVKFEANHHFKKKKSWWEFWK